MLLLGTVYVGVGVGRFPKAAKKDRDYGEIPLPADDETVFKMKLTDSECCNCEFPLYNIEV